MPDLIDDKKKNGGVPASITPVTPVTTSADAVIIPATNIADLDLAGLCMPTNVAACGETRGLHDVPIGLPEKNTYFRVHPDPTWRFGTAAAPVAVIKMENRQFFVLHGSIVGRVPAHDYQRVQLVAAITITGTPVLIPQRIDGDDGWAITLREGLAAAQLGWVRMASTKGDQRYKVVHADQGPSTPQPLWPANLTFADMMKLALRDRLITDMNHEVLARLRGSF